MLLFESRQQKDGRRFVSPVSAQRVIESSKSPIRREESRINVPVQHAAPKRRICCLVGRLVVGLQTWSTDSEVLFTKWHAAPADMSSRDARL